MTVQRATCKQCGRSGHPMELTDCTNENCKLTMAKRNNNLPALVVERSIRHRADCTCKRCLDADAANLEKAITQYQEQKKTATPKPVQISIRVLRTMSPVESTSPDDATSVHINVPEAICGAIYPKGKRK